MCVCVFVGKSKQVELLPREASQLTAVDPATGHLRDGKGLARTLLRKWLPLAPCVLQMAVRASATAAFPPSRRLGVRGREIQGKHSAGAACQF